MIKQEKQFPYNVLPFIVLLIAICFLVALLVTIRTDVFFSGDAGLKYLMVKQISRGGNYYSLNLENPSWVREIWLKGYYPFKAPFIYDTPEGKIVAFPPAFQWLNAAFYKWFGYSGIYIIPAASLIGLWTWFLIVMHRLGVKPLIISTGLILLALGSPLTVYGAVYWEHTFSILLMFGAVVFLVTPRPSYINAVISGLLSGMAVWFRPEMLVLCLLFIALILFNNFRKKNNVHFVFILSMLAGIAAFFIFNSRVYGNSLGAHSLQLANKGGIIEYIGQNFIVLTHVNARLVIFFPAIILLYAFAFYILFKKIFAPAGILQLTVIVILFSLITPFLLPNAGGKQWGPRYLLPLVPVVITTLCLAATYFDVQNFEKKKWLLLLIPVFLYSAYVNVYLARKYLRDDYSFRVKPGLDFLQKESCKIVVVQNQYITQEFAALLETKKMFLAENERSFYELQKLLKAAGIPKLIYMCADINKKMPLPNLINNSSELMQMGGYYFGEYNVQ